jgi:hypothetical protein
MSGYYGTNFDFDARLRCYTGVQGKNNVYHIKEKMRKTNFKLFGKSFLIVDCIGAFIYIIIAQNIRQ